MDKCHILETAERKQTSEEMNNGYSVFLNLGTGLFVCLDPNGPLIADMNVRHSISLNPVDLSFLILYIQ